MAFKLKSGNTTNFKQMGSSPAKQKVDPLDLGLLDEAKKFKKTKSNMKAKTHMKMDINLENKKALNQKIAKVTKSTMPKNFNMTGKDSWIKRSKEILKKSAKKGGKFLGNRATGVLGLLGGGSLNATATNPNVKKSEGQQIKDLLTKHKLKGGKK